MYKKITLLLFTILCHLGWAEESQIEYQEGGLLDTLLGDRQQTDPKDPSSTSSNDFDVEYQEGGLLDMLLGDNASNDPQDSEQNSSNDFDVEYQEGGLLETLLGKKNTAPNPTADNSPNAVQKRRPPRNNPNNQNTNNTNIEKTYEEEAYEEEEEEYEEEEEEEEEYEEEEEEEEEYEEEERETPDYLSEEEVLEKLLALGGQIQIGQENRPPSLDVIFSQKFGLLGKHWETKLAGSQWSNFSQKITINNNKIYVASENIISVLNLNTGDIENTIEIVLSVSNETGAIQGLPEPSFATETFEEFEPIVVSGPVMAKNHLILGTQSGLVIALDPLSAKVQWVKKVNGLVDLVHFFKSQNLVMVQGLDDTISFFNLTDGSLYWTHRDPQNYPHLKLLGKESLLMHQGQLLLGTDSGNLLALDVPNKQPLWYININADRLDPNKIVDIDMPIIYNPAKQVIYVLPSNERIRTYSLKDQTPQAMWSSPKENDSHIYFDFYGQPAYLASYSNQKQLSIYNPNNGSKQCSKTLPNYFAYSKITPFLDHLVLTNQFGDLNWFDPSSCEQVELYPIENETVVIRPVVHKNTIYLLNSAGYLYAISATKPQNN